MAKWVEEEQELVKDGMWKGQKLRKNEGLVYKHMTFVEGNKDVLGVLKDVADQVGSIRFLLSGFALTSRSLSRRSSYLQRWQRQTPRASCIMSTEG